MICLHIALVTKKPVIEGVTVFPVIPIGINIKILVKYIDDPALFKLKTNKVRSLKLYRVIQSKRAKIKQDIGDAPLNNLRLGTWGP